MQVNFDDIHKIIGAFTTMALNDDDVARHHGSHQSAFIPPEPQTYMRQMKQMGTWHVG